MKAISFVSIFVWGCSYHSSQKYSCSQKYSTQGIDDMTLSHWLKDLHHFRESFPLLFPTPVWLEKKKWPLSSATVTRTRFTELFEELYSSSKAIQPSIFSKAWFSNFLKNNKLHFQNLTWNSQHMKKIKAILLWWKVTESGKWERISPDFPPALHSHPGHPQRPQEPFGTLQGSNFWIAFPPASWGWPQSQVQLCAGSCCFTPTRWHLGLFFQEC